MINGIEIYLNDELIKTYHRRDDKPVVCPRVGEYISIEGEELQVAKIVHDLWYGYIRIDVKTKRRKI